MPPRTTRRLAVASITATALILASACQSRDDTDHAAAQSGPTASRP